MYVGVLSAGMSVYFVLAVPVEAKEFTGSPGSYYSFGCEPLWGCWEPNLGLRKNSQWSIQLIPFSSPYMIFLAYDKVIILAWPAICLPVKGSTALSEDLSSVPSTHVGWFTDACNSSSRGSEASGLHRFVCTCIHMHSHTVTYMFVHVCAYITKWWNKYF